MSPRSKPGKLRVEFRNMQNYVDEREGGYYITGTRIALSSIVHAFLSGESPDEILRSFPLAGPLVKIYGAITFYLENTEKVEEYLKEIDRRWEALRREYPKANDPLAKKLREAKEHATQTRS